MPDINWRAILGNAYNEWTAFGAANGGKIRGSNEGYLVLETNPAGSDKKIYLNAQSPGNIIMATGGGNVGIGTADPKSNKLAVEGTIAARRVKVTQANPWPDYVFGDNYVLKSLSETEKFIQEHKHLPEIPSAKEVAENGQDLGEMNRKLLEKMEEMTLHMIRMQKQIDQLESQIKKQQQPCVHINPCFHRKTRIDIQTQRNVSRLSSPGIQPSPQTQVMQTGQSFVTQFRLHSTAPQAISTLYPCSAQL